MNMERKEIDKLSGELLKKSLQKPELRNFDDALMNKILELPKHSPTYSSDKLFKNGWRFLILSMALLIASLAIVSYLSAESYAEINRYLVATKIYILYGGMALFVPLLFTQLDSLLKSMFNNRYHPRVNY
jgi:hypothetical protein